MKTSRASSLVGSFQVGNNGTGAVPFVSRTESAKILGDAVASALGSLAVITKRIYFFPVQFQKQTKISKLRVNVTNSASNSVCSVGIYNNKRLTTGNDNPGNLLEFVDTLITTTTGDKDAATAFTFNKDTLYWIGVVCGGAPTLRALTISSLYTHLGRVPNTNNAYTHLYKNLTNYVLPTVAPTDLTISTGNIPAVYIVE